MNRLKKKSIILWILGMSILMWGIGSSSGAPDKTPPGKAKKIITHTDRKAAAKRAAESGFELQAIGMADMVMPGEAPHYFSHPNYANSPLPRNSVSEWNAFAQEILQPSSMPGMDMGANISMSAAFVYLAYVQGAVYNALASIEGGYTPYESVITADPDASRDAAVAAAAYGVLKHYFPTNALLEEKYSSSLAPIPDGIAKMDGIAAGEAAAAEIIALRSSDVLTGDGGYILPAPGPGIWEPTATMPSGDPMPPMDPWMAKLQPFLRNGAADLRPVPPPALTDDIYTTDFNEVKEIGGAMSMTRTPEQTEVARFWATNMVIQANSAYRTTAASRGLGLLETARLMAMGNMAAVDSLIATFDAKYHYNFWRPVTAIQRADTDGNPLTEPDPTWMPVVMTPNFPEYVAGHGSFVSAQGEVFNQILGTPQIEIDLESTNTNTTRHFATIDDLRTEIVNARTWGGLHFRNSSELAVALGQQIVLNASANYFTPATDLSAHVMFSGGIRKFVDTLPGLGASNANNLGQYIPIAIPDTTSYPGSDYYEIGVIQYREQMHSDLPATLLRGYVQLSTPVVPGAQVPLANALLDGTSSPIIGQTGVTPAHYLGPTIVATKDRPVRIKFYNLLPTGIRGDLFIPVDTTVMGSGMGPEMTMDQMDPQNPMCGNIDKPYECYTENRATLHLHGGISPWISDGTPHQWITPANEITPYPQGVSVVPVPDMDDPGDPNDGVMTFYYTNQQSARLMFYHDHAWGITRLNVYAGEAAPYIIQDEMEIALIGQGLIPGADATIPLVVQDKTFVPTTDQLAVQDNTWDLDRWGGFGSLWLPHVYSPAQNPGDASGVNQFGRWAYGPWFWPPTSSIEYGPIPNPYYDPNCDPDAGWCEPEMMPGVPFNSMGMESFMDTPVVNGTAYPTMTVEPKAYRFRILNAANDRFFNLSIYRAASNEPMWNADGTLNDGNAGEVALNPAEVAAALEDPAGIFPTPVTGIEGPNWIQIGTEGGFLPAPVVIPAQPTTWVTDPTVFNAGNVDKHSLLIAPAERADVIVDFSAYAGQTLILYNDAPAAFPARDPRYDYYTGNPDLTDTGGTPPTMPGYGPNTRTVMQIRVAEAPVGEAAATFNVGNLETAFKSKTLGGIGVFEDGQHPIVVGQQNYNSAYNTAFNVSDGLVQIFNTSLTFKTLAGGLLTMPLEPKMIQDEMGEAFEHEYGRMSGFLGVETPNAQAGLQNMILYSYASPPTEILAGIQLPEGVELQPITTTTDGTQIWKITHNGVDTHPIHFHLYDVQLINRVGWDGIIRKPDPNELGWKDTVRISPLEDTIVAMRPLLPKVPWDLPNSVRLIDPSMPEGAYLANTTAQEAAGLPIFAFDPNGEPIDIINHKVNFGWEYVWHCHILSHEEMDMMHAQAVAVLPKPPTGLAAVRTGNGRNRVVNLSWMDNSLNETKFSIERAAAFNGPWTLLSTMESITGPSVGQLSYVDTIGNTNQTYYYRVKAINEVGDTHDYSDPNLNEGAGFPTKTMESEFSNTATFGSFPPAAPSNLSATATRVNNNSDRVTLNWTDNSNNETGFTIQRSSNAAFSAGITNSTVGANVTTFTTGNLPRNTTYWFRVAAVNSGGASDWSNTVSITTP